MTPGIHQLSMPEYLCLKALSSGLVHTMLSQSPYHAKAEQDAGPTETSAVAEVGTAIHDGLLEGLSRIAIINPEDYAGPKGGIPKGWTTDIIRAARDAALADGKIPMFPEKAANVLSAVAAAKAYVAQSEIKGVFESGRPEQTLIWKEGDVLCKARPDWLTADHGILLHVKTTAGSAQPESWIRNQLVNSGYDVAYAFYERGLYAATDGKGKDAPLSVFLVIEQQPPFGCSLVSLSPAFAELAESKIARAIAQWQKCVASGRYPSYPKRIAYAEPRPWEISGEEEQSITAFTESELEGGIPL